MNLQALCGGNCSQRQNEALSAFCRHQCLFLCCYNLLFSFGFNVFGSAFLFVSAMCVLLHLLSSIFPLLLSFYVRAVQNFSFDVSTQKILYLPRSGNNSLELSGPSVFFFVLTIVKLKHVCNALQIHLVTVHLYFGFRLRVLQGPKKRVRAVSQKKLQFFESLPDTSNIPKLKQS